MKKQCLNIVNIFLLSGILFSGTSYADRVNISLNNKAALLEYQPGGDIDVESDIGGASFGLLFNDDGDWMVSGKLLVSGVNDSGIQLSPGVKVNAISADDIDSSLNFSLAIGGRASGQLQTTFPLRAYAEFFYAPSITSFNDLESVSEFDLGVEHPIGNNAGVFIGYRRVNVDVDDSSDDIKLDNRLHAGVSLTF